MENTDEINRYIHVEIMGKCWHVSPPDTPRERYGPCPKCGKFEHRHPNPDYCSGSSPRSLLNEVVAKVCSFHRGPNISSWNPKGCESIESAFMKHARYDTKGEALVFALNATAEQIARACVEAHKATQSRED